MIKESITDDFSVNITWSGYGNTVEIASRKLTRAVYGKFHIIYYVHKINTFMLRKKM